MASTHDLVPETIRVSLGVVLRTYPAAAMDAKARVRRAHWHARGPGLVAGRALFEELTEDQVAPTGQIAQRAAALGGVESGTVQGETEHPCGMARRIALLDSHAAQGQ